MNRVFLIAIFFFIFISFMNLNAQWLKGYGEGVPRSIQQTSDGGYIVAGVKGLVAYEGWLLKLDSEGDVEWRKSYENYHAFAVQCAQQTSDGGYIVAGGSGLAWVGARNLLIIKLNSAGDIKWQRDYGGNGYAYSIQETSDGGYIVGGDTDSFGAGGSDAWVLKLDSAGDIEWQRTYGGNDYDDALSIQEISDGGYIVAGITSSLEYGWGVIWVLKLDLAGDIEWQRDYGGNCSTLSIQETSDGGCVVAGCTYCFGTGSSDAWVLKLDLAGDIEWQRAYGGSDYDHASSIQETSDGGYIVGGGTDSVGVGERDGWFLKLDSVGDIEWQGALGGIYYDSALSIQETSDGGYIAAGSIQGGGGSWAPRYDNIRVLKLFSDGDIHTYCEYIRSSNATITDTDISPEVLYLSCQDTNVTPLDTDFSALLISENITGHVLCPLESTLDDEDECFIATVAYGSPLHPHIDILRNFRDKYFMPNKLGRMLVNLYYKYSPYFADLIVRYKALKVVVRINLLPFVVFSYSMVHFGPIITGVILIFVFMLPFFLVMFNRRKLRQVR